MYAKYIESDGRFAFAEVDNGGVEITQEEYQALFDGQALGKIIVPDENGYPVLSDPPAPTEEELADIVRADRNARLSACDWTQLTDAPLAPEAKTAWAVYRQALRDVPGQAGFPDTIAWPVAP